VTLEYVLLLSIAFAAFMAGRSVAAEKIRRDNTERDR